MFYSILCLKGKNCLKKGIHVEMPAVVFFMQVSLLIINHSINRAFDSITEPRAICMCVVRGVMSSFLFVYLFQVTAWQSTFIISAYYTYV